MLARELRPSGSKGRAPQLTARQLEVLELVAGGRSNREIASLLRVSENGVKAHIARLLLKFGVPNRAALVRVALPQDHEVGGSVREIYELLHETLSEVLGRTATEALLRRALRRASARDPDLSALARRADGGAAVQWWTDERRGMSSLRSVMRELWPLLIEVTGPVMVAQLERRGIGPEGSPRRAGVK